MAKGRQKPLFSDEPKEDVRFSFPLSMESKREVRENPPEKNRPVVTGMIVVAVRVITLTNGSCSERNGSFARSDLGKVVR
jgi:hypothetical protein